jgi:cytochrome oxidase assembly protein ShyY1
MWGLLRTRRWQGFTLLVIVAIVGFGLLSAWQWQRADEERMARIALLTQTAQQPTDLTTGITEAGSQPPDDLRIPVSVTGVYEPDTTVLVRQRPLEGRNGFWVGTVLRVDDQTRLWVNRGWIPAVGSATSAITAPAPPVGEVTVNGWLVPSETTREVITDLPDGQVRWLDTAALAARIGGGEPLSVYLERNLSAPGEPGVRPLPLPELDETQNISYAVQWLVFAAIALTGWFFFLRREAREDTEMAETVSAT